MNSMPSRKLPDSMARSGSAAPRTPASHRALCTTRKLMSWETTMRQLAALVARRYTPPRASSTALDSPREPETLPQSRGRMSTGWPPPTRRRGVAELTASAAKRVKPPQPSGSCQGPPEPTSGWTHRAVMGRAKLT